MPEPGHVLWLTFPSYGHIKATCGMVAELCRRGHRVTYLVADRYASWVSRTGARVVPYRSDFPLYLTDTSATTMTIEFLRESFAPMEAALNLAAADRPDVVVYDVLASDTATAVARRYGAPTVRFYAGLGTNEHVPQNGTEPDPHQVPFDPADPRVRGLSAQITARVEVCGVTELAGGPGTTDPAALNISAVTREFQMRGDTFGDDWLFAGPCLRRADFQGAFRPPGDRRVLLLSLGTSSKRRPDFFRTAVAAFAGADWHVVMTLGPGVDPASLGTLPPNVEAHSFVPHLAVLRHASAFVCQGGTGSLMEAFHMGVPVVVVPQQWDQQAIARRVVELGIGRVIQPPDLDGTTLRGAVDAITGDPTVRSRVAAMRRSLRTAPGAPGVAGRLETIMQRVPAGR